MTAYDYAKYSPLGGYAYGVVEIGTEMNLTFTDGIGHCPDLRASAAVVEAIRTCV